MLDAERKPESFQGKLAASYEMCNKKYLIKNFRKILFKKDLTYYLFINKSHDQYTLRHSPDASLPGRACWI